MMNNQVMLMVPTAVKVCYLEVRAGVRYWEDATVNGVEDTDGALIPRRDKGNWRPVIRLTDGQIMDWPADTEASIHYKVCDDGDYWLLDDDFKRVAKWLGDYVPDGILCIGDDGYGDYIILKVMADGRISGWTNPDIDSSQWKPTFAAGGGKKEGNHVPDA